MSNQKTIDDVMTSINATCRAKGGKYGEYSCQTVSWDDVQRGQVDGQLSCWGSNITDTRLWEKNGARLFTVRSDNWNEKLGKVSADKIALLVGNHKKEELLETVSLEKFLKFAGQFGSYARLSQDQNLSSENLDTEISIRFQTTFLPVNDEQKATLEFATEAYNYNTRSDLDPRNILLLCTTQGTAIQQDGAQAKKLYHHRVGQDGVITRHWLEAERTEHKVGGEQVETMEERNDAITRRKATSELIGIASLGSRFNVLMTIQVPLKQKSVPSRRHYQGAMMGCSLDSYGSLGVYESSQPLSATKLQYKSSKLKKWFAMPAPRYQNEMVEEYQCTGRSNAARVSRGSKVDTWDGLTVKNPERHPSEHITVTVVIYNTVAGGVPSEDDVIAAIDDMEQLYESCAWTGRLADDGASFMKSELTVKDMMDIEKKISTQPHPDHCT